MASVNDTTPNTLEFVLSRMKSRTLLYHDTSLWSSPDLLNVWLIGGLMWLIVSI